MSWLDTILTADGKTTGLANIWQLIANKLSKERERSIEEVAGCRNMLIRIYTQAHELYPLRENDIRALHTELMKPYEGKFSQDSRDYKIEYFLSFMVKVMRSAISDIEISRNRFAAIQTLSASALKVLTCFKDFPEIRLNTKQICAQTELPRRTVINSLNTLLQHELIQKYGQGAGTKYQLTF